MVAGYRCPTSFGNASSITFANKTYEIESDYMGLTMLTSVRLTAVENTGKTVDYTS